MSQMKHTSTFQLIFRHELTILTRDRTLPIVAILLAAMVLGGLFVGITQAKQRSAMIAEVIEHSAKRQAANEKTLQSVLDGKQALVPFGNPANPAALAGGLAGRHTTLPNLPLAALAIGQSDMVPNYYRISYLSKVQFMYDTEIENPWNLLSGHFDLSFVITFVLPLLVIGLSFNMLSAEREQGTLRMLFAQPMALTTLIAAKASARYLVFLAVILPLPPLVLLSLFPETRSMDSLLFMALWALVVAGYTLFWFALAALVNAFGRASSSNALILISGWTFLVLILPIVMNLVVGAISPAPSRTELASRTRVVTADALREYEDMYSTDYRYASDPETLAVKDGRIEVPPRMRAFFLAKQRVDAQVEPLLNQFDHQLLEQQKLVDLIGFLSPAILVNEALNLVAGNDSRRFVAFKNQTEAFHNGWRAFFAPKIATDRATTRAEMTALPVWQRQETATTTTAWRIASRAALLLLVSFIIAIFAMRRLRHGQIV
ncbi:DUF3526 domain-containing protein [Tardiphaga alba]|uniref:DUF3526 domain-containing protein n=1 Tax=Tardiphaga alba TaxID=340268 RepID=A0ABX8A320_9BRAD|nr:DUF3526 domain-containing protein [Tardiphaga alba]QUS37782.1 DUF3526 domain-containing protein [Tardiphaga alba]